MSRRSLRKKQYRPLSADFTKVSESLSSMFGNDNEKTDKQGNVLLITYKRSVTEIDSSPLNSPPSFLRTFSQPGMTRKDSLITEQIQEDQENQENQENQEVLEVQTVKEVQEMETETNLNLSLGTEKAEDLQVYPELNGGRRRTSQSLSSGESWGSEEGRTYQNARDKDDSSCDDIEVKGDNNSPSTIWEFTDSHFQPEKEAWNSTQCWNKDVNWENIDRSFGKDPSFEVKDEVGWVPVHNVGWENQFIQAVPSVPLASEDSDLGESADFESFSSEDDEDNEAKHNLTPTTDSKEDYVGLGFTRSLRDRFHTKASWIRRSSERDIKLSRDSSPSEISESKVLAESKLSRLFSLRRSIGPTSLDRTDSQMPRLTEEEELHLSHSSLDTPQPLPSLEETLPSLPLPLHFKSRGVKRRCIINSLVESENSYIASLTKLAVEYKVYLESASPPILSETKIETLFFRIPEILACHLYFKESLRSALQNWEQNEMIGEVFVSNFSSRRVLETYADYINNFNSAMEVAKAESKRKSAFADFLKVKQLQSADRLNLFGLMVKPIQRFPQFIMLVQDLLKETPPGHQDRMGIQQALTTLECLTGMLNERKRISEQSAAFKTNMRSIGSKLGRSEVERVLIRGDEVRLLEFNHHGQICRVKQRKLLLLNDSVVCVSVSGRPSEVEFISPGSQERMNLKWSVAYNDIEIVDGPAQGTLARLTAGGSVAAKRSSLGRTANPVTMFNGNESGEAEKLAAEMADLMYDYDVMSRISTMLDTMKGSYPKMTSGIAGDLLNQIQTSIRQKDEEMSYLDKCCLHLAIRKKDRPETITLQMQTPKVKDEWIVELRLARLAVDPSNSPSWNTKDDLIQPVTRLPLFVKNVVSHSISDKQTEITCGLSYTLMVETPTRTLKPVSYIWTNCTDGTSSSLRIYSAIKTQQVVLKELGTINPPCLVNSLIFVPKAPGLNSMSSEDRRTDQVWVSGTDKTILIYTGLEAEKGRELGRIYLVAEPVVLHYHGGGTIWVGLADGTLYIYRRGLTGLWDTNNPQVLLIGSDPVSCLSQGSGILYAATGRRITLVDCESVEIEKSFIISHPEIPETSRITHVARAGVGLWVAMSKSSLINLYHTETLAHIQNIDLSENVDRVLSGRENGVKRFVHITSLSVSTGLLWIGTNVGLALTIPLPRLGGIPTISGSANISYHAHYGPVRMFLPINQSIITEDLPVPKKSYRLSTTSQDTIEEEPEIKIGIHKLSSVDRGAGITKRYSSPRLGSRRDSVQRKISDSERRGSKTLPRGFSLANHSDCGDSIYGLYEDLLNVQDYDCESSELNRSRQNCHKSDPELNTIPYRVSTLDRRMTMKLQRPRSLDLSSWSVESRSSSHTNSSSDGSEKALTPSVSRNASFVSQKASEPALLRQQSMRKPAKPKSELSNRTLTTLMGGRGYINWRTFRSCPQSAKFNNNDASLIIWDQKI